MAYLLKERNGRMFIKEAELIADPKIIRGLFHPLRLNILTLLAEKPRHASEIARILGEHEQKIYYHMRQLENLGLISLVKKQEIYGAVAKIYTPTKYAFAFDLPYGEERLFDVPISKKDNTVYKFFFPHITSGKLDCKIIVGSPDPHGPYQVRARDSHYAVELAYFLGQYASNSSEFLVKLDIDLKVERSYDNNLILIGGVLTNVITAEINKYLPIKFEMNKFPFRNIISSLTNKNYDEENCGIIAKLPNPYNKDKSIIVFAGNRFSGTKAAIFGFTKKNKDILHDYDGQEVWGRVVKGLDMDGDGKIDDIEILE